MSAPTHTDRFPPPVTTPATPPEPEGRLVRSQARPGLTGVGVAVLGTGVAVVAAILSELITDGLGWVFAVPFVFISGYCAYEVAQNSLRSALVMPPLVTFVVAAIDPIWGSTAGIRGWMVKTLTTLTTLAPTMVIATAVAGAIVGWRYWRSSRPGRRP
ncbi:MAG: DUF6542 domain-containing protein [Actinomycetes bacterium]